MEPNIIFVREKGVLRQAVSGLLLTQVKPTTSCSRAKPFIFRKFPFSFTSIEEGNIRYTAKSLFDITLSFVANNIQHVESLVGFPEQIGQKLFVATVDTCLFLKPHLSPIILKLFNDAYGEVVLESLCLKNRFPLFHERMEAIRAFHSLKSLDLSGCRLGDNHEIFQHLASTSLAGLTRLFISGNGLSDIGLQRLTAPIRIMRKGLSFLQLLDLSQNPITDKALRYLTCLPRLQQLDVSDTHIKLSPDLKVSIKSLLGLIHSEQPLDPFDHSGCKTKGWAEQVVNQWEMIDSQMPKVKKVEAAKMSALRFFDRQKFIRDVLNAASPSRNGAKSIEKLHFYKPATANPVTQTPSTSNGDVNGSGTSSKKRKQEPESEDSLQTRKRPSSSAFTVEDMDLLNSY